MVGFFVLLLLLLLPYHYTHTQTRSSSLASRHASSSSSSLTHSHTLPHTHTHVQVHAINRDTVLDDALWWWSKPSPTHSLKTKTTRSKMFLSCFVFFWNKKSGTGWWKHGSVTDKFLSLTHTAKMVTEKLPKKKQTRNPKKKKIDSRRPRGMSDSRIKPSLSLFLNVRVDTHPHTHTKGIHSLLDQLWLVLEKGGGAKGPVSVPPKPRTRTRTRQKKIVKKKFQIFFYYHFFFRKAYFVCLHSRRLIGWVLCVCVCAWVFRILCAVSSPNEKKNRWEAAERW